MSVVVRYITNWTCGDPYICEGRAGSGVWAQDSRGLTKIEFEDEAAAKAFLHRHGYDLNPLQTVFETVDAPSDDRKKTNRILKQAEEIHAVAISIWGEQDKRTIWYRDNVEHTRKHYENQS